MTYFEHLKANWKVAFHSLGDFLEHFIHGLFPCIRWEHQQPTEKGGETDTNVGSKTRERKMRRKKMKEVTQILRLLTKAIEQNTVNTYHAQGIAAADVVFRILEDAEKKIDALDHLTEKGDEGK